MTQDTRLTAIALLAFASQLAAQITHTVVPAAHATSDAVGLQWLPGASDSNRQQILIGASHLAGLAGRSLTAIEFRRSASAEAFAGGSCTWIVELSICPHSPLECSPAFAANSGTAPVQVWSGPVTLPSSPATTAGVASWGATDTVRIEFATAFAYTGGTLCIDIRGEPIQGQQAAWWMADCDVEAISGTAQDLGGGCGSFGGAGHRWAFCAERSLLPGGRARFFAEGPTDGIALALFGQPSALGLPLATLGLPTAQECALHLATIDAVVPAVFPAPQTALPIAADAEVVLSLPPSSAVLGLTFGTQWLEWSQLATSNAIAWTIAPAVPTLDMATIDGDPLDATGHVSVRSAPVLRFESQ